MASILLRRLRDLLIVLFLVGSTMFFIIHLIPGSPAVSLLGPEASEAQIAALTKEMGLDSPIHIQYFNWIGEIVRGNLGNSSTFSQPVSQVIMEHAMPTITLAVASTIISLAIAVPVAVQAAAKPRSVWARWLTPLIVFGLAVPEFWLALVLVLFFGVIIAIFPVTGYVDVLSDPIQAIPYLILPVVVLVSRQTALIAVTLRESISGEMLNVYLRTARAKGVGERRVLFRHVLPNALLPTITIVGSSFGHLLGGIVVLETVFAIPGWGGTLYNAILSRDYSVVLGLTLVIAVVFVVVNLVTDLLYILADPKVRVQ